jgi:hypothetical protein
VSRRPALATALLLVTALTAACGTTREPLFEGYETEAAGETVDADRAATLAGILDDLARGSAGDGAATDRACRNAEALQASAPGPRADAALGAAVLLGARDAGLFDRLEALDRGGALLDAAADAAPDDPVVRYLRAVSTFPLPSIAGRGDQTDVDLAWLDERLDVDDPLWTAERKARAQCMYAVVLADRGDEGAARRRFERAIELAPDGPAGRRAADELARR